MNADALKQLKDIHLPAPEAWWHLPWGVWLLLGCACLLVLLMVWAWRPLKQRYHAKKHKQARQDAIRQEIQQIEQDFEKTEDALAMISAVSILLRRVSITLFKNAHVEGLIQSQWLAFLDRQWKKECPNGGFSAGNIGPLLSTAAYRKNLDEALQKDAVILLNLSKRWLHEVADV
ncbi:MAG: DUF4381 domain-containing protein [Zetaproteobacteria bacterium]|nr:DUF4381 domain-containing protein [Zetaproteobacteria bacterium]